ncbi:hypothetical protein A9K71_12930 [Mesorhizobium sp. WSM3873]|nr:hypothetical protein A9K71_12930 [Mesorhizobium sp. WSM3873]
MAVIQTLEHAGLLSKEMLLRATSCRGFPTRVGAGERGGVGMPFVPSGCETCIAFEPNFILFLWLRRALGVTQSAGRTSARLQV